MHQKLTVYVATGSLSITSFQRELIRIHPYFTWNDTSGCWQDDNGHICHEASCTITFLLGYDKQFAMRIVTQIREWLGNNSEEQQIAYDLVKCQAELLDTIK